MNIVSNSHASNTPEKANGAVQLRVESQKQGSLLSDSDMDGNFTFQSLDVKNPFLTPTLAGSDNVYVDKEATARAY